MESNRVESRTEKEENTGAPLPVIREAIVVEGRDDTSAVRRAVSAETIETHGFGIRAETWERIETAYRTRGIIIFTDPDHAGNEIRRRIKERFPDAGEAFLSRTDAEKDGDIGIENASPEAILQALQKIHFTVIEERKEFSYEDLVCGGLSGRPGSRKQREKLGKALGIGYGNAAAMIEKLNRCGITREEYYEALRTIND